MGYLSQEALSAIGFRSLGSDVKISEKASIYGAENISIGDNARIDDFALLSAGSGGIEIGRYVHIACFALLIGKARISLRDYAGVSSRVSIYSSSDKYDGEYMTNPCLPVTVRNTYHKDVFLGKHVVVGASSVVLPGVMLNDGCAVGAMSLVTASFEAMSILVGVPAKKIGVRKDNILKLEALLG
jgi:acetyltransferase-like isoleucine patch superfamily enzyme